MGGNRDHRSNHVDTVHECDRRTDRQIELRQEAQLLLGDRATRKHAKDS